jgi:3-oxoacyl-[acyl-carrier-protein] synthase II
MAAALREAASSPAAIGYAATHGNGTRLGDQTEARALRTVFNGTSAGVAASSVTPATGYMVAAAGAFNVAVAAMALRYQVAPPTLNLTSPDPECAFSWVSGAPRELHGNEALALARGLDGQNVAITLRAEGHP